MEASIEIIDVEPRLCWIGSRIVTIADIVEGWFRHEIDGRRRMATIIVTNGSFTRQGKLADSGRWLCAVVACWLRLATDPCQTPIEFALCWWTMIVRKQSKTIGFITWFQCVRQAYLKIGRLLGMTMVINWLTGLINDVWNGWPGLGIWKGLLNDDVLELILCTFNRRCDTSW